MGPVEFEARSGLRYCLLASAAIAAALTITGDVADARRHHHSRAHHAHAGHGHGHRHAHLEDYSPPFSSIVVDGNSGSILQAASPDALRHPASLTKVMTLYLLFERLENGKLRLDSPLKVSEHASEEAPTKLGLKPGQTISVEDAIKGIVTKSANDAAVAVAENLGGDEDSFAKLMTQKAHAIGMAHTIYVNASGLPDDDQVLSAGAAPAGQLRATTGISPQNLLSITAKRCVITTICSAWSMESTASKPVSRALPALICSLRCIGTAVISSPW